MVFHVQGFEVTEFNLTGTFHVRPHGISLEARGVENLLFFQDIIRFAGNPSLQTQIYEFQ